MGDKANLYPPLPHFDSADSALAGNTILRFQENPESLVPQSYRLSQINEIKKYFEEEIEFRRKYKKAFDIFTGLSHFLNLTSAAAGSIGVTALAGIITAPIGMALGGEAIGTAVVSSGLTWEKKNILRKLSKHERIMTLAISKLNTMNDLVSKALTDSVISSEEFSLIIKEYLKEFNEKGTKSSNLMWI